MSSGHASHKGPGVKQSHDTGKIDSAATTPVDDPQDLLDEGEGYPFNRENDRSIAEATERPNSSSSEPFLANEQDELP